MICKTKDCTREVTRLTKLGMCDACYRREVYGKNFKSIPRRGGGTSGVWTRCWRKDCKKRFKAKAWQDPKYSLCPRCKEKAEELGVGLEWVERQVFGGAK